MNEATVTRSSVEAVARAAALRLVATQGRTGAMMYRYDPIHDRINDENYNMVRMAGTTYSLCWAADYFQHEDCGARIREAALRAIAFLQFACRCTKTGYVGGFNYDHGFSEDGSMGATALFLNALLFPGFREQFADDIQRLLEIVLKAQTQEGSILSYPHRKDRFGGQRYYSGEALLALVRYAEFCQDPAVLNAVEKAFPYYRDYFTFDPHVGFVMWHTDTWSRLARLKYGGATHGAAVPEHFRYLEFAKRLVAFVIKRQQGPQEPPHTAREGGFGKQPGISSALYLESIARLYQACRHCNESHDLEAYGSAIRRGLAFVARLQITPAQAEPFPHAGRAVGGCRSSLNSWELRMDNDQHALTACLASLETAPLD